MMIDALNKVIIIVGVHFQPEKKNIMLREVYDEIKTKGYKKVELSSSSEITNSMIDIYECMSNTEKMSAVQTHIIVGSNNEVRAVRFFKKE